MVGQTVSHYKILEELGGGGMGVVYRAQDIRLKRTVALKFLSPELTRDSRAKHRFINEARAASQLDHPNICTIHEIEETDDGQLFLVLSCYDGETVRDRLEKGPMPVDEAVGLALHVARGLERAHQKSIVHRDIKPANIFLTDDGRAKILDFGLAKLAGQTKLTRAGGTMGTVAYMSPEQARGEEVSARTDIWSLGVVLYEALSGEPPFPGERIESVLYSVVHEEPKPLGELRHDVPTALESIVRKCLSKNPEERFANASELAAALEPLRGRRTSGSSLIELGSTTKIPAEPKSRKALAAALVVVLALAGASATPWGRSAVGSWLGGWFVGASLPELKQLAVMPFLDPSGEDQALATGLDRHIAFSLSQLQQHDSSFRVVPPKEIVEYEVATPAEARAKVGATVALVGAVERDGADLSVALELVDATSSKTLSSWQHSDDLANVAAFQEDPATAVAERLELDLPRRERGALTEGGTTVPGAFESYLRGLGRLWAAKDDTTEHVADAVALLEKAVRLDPSFALGHAELARARWVSFQEVSKDPEEAVRAGECARRAIELDAGLPNAHEMAGRVESHFGRHEEAIREFRLALDADPINFQARWLLALENEAAGNPGLAEVALDEGIEVRPDHWHARYALAYFYYKRDRFEDALRTLADASALAPGNPDPYNLSGCIYYDTDRLNEAWAMLERSAEARPSRAAFSNIGTLYFVGARYVDAARMYEKAIEVEDDPSRAWTTWGNLAAANNQIPGREERARECYARALGLAREQLRVRPEDADLITQLAVYSAGVGDTTAALGYLGNAVALSPDDESVMFQMGLTYEVLGRREEALDWLESAVENGYSREQVEGTPDLRELCADERYRRRIGRVGDHT